MRLRGGMFGSDCFREGMDGKHFFRIVGDLIITILW